MHFFQNLNFAISLLLCAIARMFYSTQANSVLLRVHTLIRERPPEKDFEHLINALVQAEDHRFYLHYGVDVYAIFRAITMTTLVGKTQGASTITQQLVRVVTGDFRKSIPRKLKELCLATWIDSKIPKQAQAIAYLYAAYYGWKMNGLDQAMKRLNIRFPCTPCDSAAIIARLKYPEPQHPSLKRAQKILIRKKHILHLMKTQK